MQSTNSDFKNYINKDYYYVDKTLFIEELLNNKNDVILLPRPRRFGKTLNLSMLKYYFDINEDNRHLFKGLKIENSDTFEKHVNKYPVIFLTLKEIQGNSWEDIYGLVKLSISNLYKEHKYLLDSDKIGDHDKIIINKIIMREAGDADYKTSLKTLSEYMYKHYGKEVVILLDEYDSLLNDTYSEKIYDNIIRFMRLFIGSAFKGNNFLFKGIITGVLKIAKESIFSGANNILVRTILDIDFSDKFGFTDAEVLQTLKCHGIEGNIKDVREWYNGYIFGNNIIYNPFSIANYIQKRALEEYWINSGGTQIISKLLYNSDTAIKENLEELMKGNKIKAEIETNIVFNELDDSRYLWSLLLFSGYLNCTKIDRNIYELKIPNKEVILCYRSIAKTFFNKLTKNAIKIVDSIKDEDIKLFKKELEKIILNMLSNHDLTSENSYHNFLLGLLAYLCDEYEVKSNREAGHGRYDIAIIPYDINKSAYIIELKLSNNKNIVKNKKDKKNENKEDIVEELSKKALKQIETRKYANEISSKGVKKIILLGIGFEGKELHIIDKNLDINEI